MTINVLLSGRLKIKGYGNQKILGKDGTYQLALDEKSTVLDVMASMGVPSEQVAMTMLNARQCGAGTNLKTGDRVILIPPDVAALWRFLGNQNLGAESVFDF